MASAPQNFIRARHILPESSDASLVPADSLAVKSNNVFNTWTISVHDPGGSDAGEFVQLVTYPISTFVWILHF